MRRVLLLASLCVAAIPIQVLGAADIHTEIRARAVQPGELVVMDITLSKPVTALRVRAFDRDIAAAQVDEWTWRALIGIDLGVKPGSHEVTIEATPELRAKETLHVAPHQFPSRRLKVDESFVNPPPSVESRIVEEARELSAIWRTSAPAPLWHGAFVRPVADSATSAFGSRSIFNGQPRAPHGGADFTSAAGTPIHAPAGGRIVLARDLYFTGGTVVIDHGAGVFSLLAHMSRIDVHEGDTIAAGHVVGLVGATGRVTGPHLHWAMRINDARVDPLSVLAVLGQ